MKRLLRWSVPLAAAAMLLAPAAANADSPTSLTVVGTSDVSDSGLVQNLIQPAFHAAYPQYAFKYVGSASGTAITNAETGAQGGPSVLIVHAASLENQFVANGYSYNNDYGYAIFRNDFVLAGPSADPARVRTNASSNIARAFADIAAAGLARRVTFVSRANTAGTTVAEHAIWQLVDSSGRRPAGLLLCTLSAANGGGQTPIAPGNGVTAEGQMCPGNGAIPLGGLLPTWYVGTGATQGPNVQDANACAGYSTPTNTCYVFTDRGTYDYLKSGRDAAGTIANLTILTRDNSALAPGGADELINYFHAYVINPSKPGESVNLTAAQDFVNLLTSPALQSRLKTYLDGTGDTGGAPFVADASPMLTESGLPTKATAGKGITVTGTLTNAEPGYPALARQKVAVEEIEGGLPVAVASGTTGATGRYTIRFTPHSSGSYDVATGQISQVENSTLNPVFGDILSPASTAGVRMTVTGLPAAHVVGFRRFTGRNGKLRVSGVISPAPALRGGKVELFALPVSGGREKLIGNASVKAGRKSFTIKAKLPRHARYALQLKYVQKGQASTYSGLKLVTVR